MQTLTFLSFLGTGTMLANQEGYVIGLINPFFRSLITSSLTVRESSGFSLLNFCLTGWMWSKVGILCTAMLGFIPIMSSTSHAWQSLNSLISSMRSFLYAIDDAMYVILGFSSVPKLIDSFSDFIYAIKSASCLSELKGDNEHKV